MPDYLNLTTDFTDLRIVTALDELMYWSARFGAMLLDNLALYDNIDVLDVGCGTGFPLFELANIHGPGCRFTGVDPWETAIERAREKQSVYGLTNIEFLVADGTSLPFAENSFDLITSNLGLNNFNDSRKVLNEGARVSRRGARIALTTNLTGHMREFYHIYRETLVELGMDWYLPRLEEQEQHRGSREHFCQQLELAGYDITCVIEDQCTLRYLNGTALLRHWLTRIGFMDGWRSVLDTSDEETVFTALERNLNAVAGIDGELRLTVPMLYLEGKRK
jgi:ubiquinone/menaquinone biosynthesis C-methylase UbiE